MDDRRPVTLGLATAGDAPAMGAILSDWVARAPWVPHLHDHRDDRTFCDHLIARQRVIVARDPRLLGFVAHDDEVLTALYVAPGARGLGIGQQLLDAVRKGRDRLGVWTYSANRAAIRFYQREGFRLLSTTEGGEGDDGLPDLYLEWVREPQL